MFRKDIITYMAAANGWTKKKSGEALDATIDALKMSIKSGEPLMLSGFGTLYARRREGFAGYDLNKREKVTYPASYIPTFTPGETFLREVKQLFKEKVEAESKETVDKVE